MKLSLVIPTRERSEYLRESLRTAIACDLPDMEIIVSDNASQDGTRAVVEAFDDPRLKYLNTGARVSMRQNFEFALNACSGDYIFMIGDDDGYLPGQIKHLVALIDVYQPDVLCWRLPTYSWPKHDGSATSAGVRFIRTNAYGRPVQLAPSKLKDALASADIAGVPRLPVLYHGCVRRDYLKSLAGNNGSIIGGKIPDVYFSYAAIIKGGSFIHMNHPFSINGFGHASTGGATHAYSRDDPRSKPAERFRDEASSDPLQDVIPEFVKSIPFLLFSTLLTAKRQLESQDFEINLEDWYRHILQGNAKVEPTVAERVIRLLADYAKSTGSIAQLESASRAPKRATAWLNRKLQKLERLASFKVSADENGTNDIFTASRLVDSVLGNEYARVLAGEMSSSAAWRSAMNRGLKRKLIG